MRDNILKNSTRSVHYVNNRLTLGWHYGITKNAAIAVIVRITDSTNNNLAYLLHILQRT